MQSDLLSSVVPTQFACGRDHTIVIAENRFYGFGNGQYGQFGQVKGLQQFQAAELQLGVIHQSSSSSDSSGNMMVAVGNLHTLILKDGNVYSTGDNTLGRLGLWKSAGKTEGRILFGQGYEDKISFITCGPDHSVAVSQDGYSLYAWGSCDKVGVGHPAKSAAQALEEAKSNAHDRALDGDKDDSELIELQQLAPYLERPTRFTCWNYDPKFPHRIVQVSCGAQHTIALREDGWVYTWGDGADGRLGHNGSESLKLPTPVKAFMKSEYEQVIQVCAGASHSMALDREGKVWTWGNCNYGKLGHPELEKTQAHVYKPRQVRGLTRDSKEGVVSIHCNQYHSLAITNSHKLYIWGGNHFHRLGLGDNDNQPNGRHRWGPEEVFGCGKVIRAACGLNHTVAITDSFQVFSWGQATAFKCGLPPDKGSAHFSKPRKIAFFDEKGVYKFFKETNNTFSSRQYTPVMIATGDSHSLALCEGNQVVSFGSNQFGQLGTGQQTHSDRPIPLPYFIEDHVYIRQIACGANHSLALTSNGQIYSWGSNQYGQLGLSHTENSRTPLPIKSLATTHVDTIVAGANTCAAIERLSADRHGQLNRIFTWGNNDCGQASLGPKIKKQDHPVLIDFKPQFHKVEIAIGAQHMLLLGKNYDLEKPELGLITKSRLYSVGKGPNGQLGIQTAAKSLVFNFTKVQVWEGWHKLMTENGVEDTHRERKMKRLTRERKKLEARRKALQNNPDASPSEKEQIAHQLLALEETSKDDGRVVTESDDEWDEELKLAGDDSDDEDGAGPEGASAAAAAKNRKKKKKSAAALDIYPHVQAISCSEFSSVASIQRFHDKSMDFVFAWGRHPGLFQEKEKDTTGASTASSNSSSAQDQLLPRWVSAFEGDALKLELGSKQPIFDFRIKQIVCAKSHSLILAVYNMEQFNPVVFAFGETTFGRLGVGVVDKYLSAKQQQRRLMSSGSSASGNESTDKKFLPPSLIPALSLNGKVITQIASFSDHCLALSKAHGFVYAWGQVDNGRLGLSDGLNDAGLSRAVLDPRQLPAFIGGLEGDRSSAGGAGGAGGARGSIGGASSVGGMSMGSMAGMGGSMGGMGGISGGMGGLAGIGGGGGGGFGSSAMSMAGGSDFGGGVGGGGVGSVMGGGAGGSSGGGSGHGPMSSAASSSGGVGGAADAMAIVRAGQQTRTIKYSKQMLQQMEAESRNQIGPLAILYEQELRLYNERRTKCDSQKDLLHKMILERLNQNQGDPNSITKTQMVKRRQRENEEKQAQLEQIKRAAVMAAGKRSLWDRITGRGVDLSALESHQKTLEEQDAEEEKLNKYAHSSELSTLEEAVGRLYLRPCLLFQFFQICQRAIEFKEHHVKEQKPTEIETEISFIKADASDLIFSLYDTYYDRDVRLLQVFLRMMLMQHVQINRSELILHADKIEWLVFSRAFQSGNMRRRLGDILAVAVSKLRDYDQSPAALLHNYANGRQKDVNDIRTAIRKIREKGDELVSIICSFDDGQFVRDLLACMGPYIEILFECLGKSSHKDPKIFGRGVLSVCMEVAIADMPYQFEKLLREKARDRGRLRNKIPSRKSSAHGSRRGSVMTRLSVLDGPQYSGHATPKPGRRGPSSNAAAAAAANAEEEADIEEKVEEAKYESNKLVLLNLLNPRDLKEYMAERYKVEKNVLDQTIEGGKGGKDAGGANSAQNDDLEQTLSRMKVFAFEMNRIVLSRKVDDPNLGSYDTNKVQFEKDLYNDFVTIRSRCFRRIAQITRSSLTTLGKNSAELFNPANQDAFRHKIRELEELKYPEGDDTRINVRHDVYNTDRFQKVNKCPECGLLHPFTPQIESANGRKHGVMAGLADNKSGGASSPGASSSSALAGGAGAGKSSARKLIEEDLRFPTEDCLALWSVLNEPHIKEILMSRAGATAWKEIETRLEELTAFFKKNSTKDDVQSDRYLQANTFFRQFARACRTIDKRILIYFGSDTTHYVEASTLEPIDVFTHLTSMSTQLQVDKLANENKAVVVQTVLQHMQSENKFLNEDDDRMTQEYRQLHSDTPNRTALSDTMLKQLTPLERDIFQREMIEMNIGELNVYIDTKGHIYEYSYSQLIDLGVLNKVSTDPSNFSCWTLGCLSLPCCAAAKEKETGRLIQFLQNLNFVFFTGTEEHHIVDFHLVHQNTSKLHFSAMDLKNLAKDGQHFSFVYEPRGDMVEIQDRVEFIFNQRNLYSFLHKMSRPRLHKKGMGMGEITGLDLLGWDSSKFNYSYVPDLSQGSELGALEYESRDLLHHDPLQPSNPPPPSHSHSHTHHSSHIIQQSQDDHEEDQQQQPTVSYNDDVRMQLLKASSLNSPSLVTSNNSIMKPANNNDSPLMPNPPNPLSLMTRRVNARQSNVFSLGVSSPVISLPPTRSSKLSVGLAASSMLEQIQKEREQAKLIQQQQQKEEEERQKQQQERAARMASPELGLSALSQSRPSAASAVAGAGDASMSMDSPEVPTLSPHPFVQQAMASGGAFPPLLQSPAIQITSSGLALDNRRTSPQTNHISSSQPVGSNRVVSLADVLAGRIQQSPRNSIQAPEIVQNHQSDNSLGIVHQDASHTDASRESEKRRKHHKHHHRDRERHSDSHKRKHSSDKDENGDHTHRHHHHSSSHRSSSSNSRPAKEPRTHSADHSRPSSTANAVHVKREPGAFIPAAAHTSYAARGSSPAAPLFPDGDEDFFSSDPLKSIKGVGLMNTTLNTQIKRVVKGKEANLKEKAEERKRQSAPLSKQFTTTSNESDMRDVIDIDVSERDQIVDIPLSPATLQNQQVIVGAGVAKAKALNLTTASTPPRARGVGALLKEQFADADENELRTPARDQNSAANMYGSGGHSSGERGGSRRGKKGRFESMLEEALRLSKSESNLLSRQRMDQAASSIMSANGQPLVDKHTQVVRVLKCEKQFGVRIALVSLVSKAIPAKHTIHPPSFLSPLSVLASNSADVARFVARISNTSGSSVPPSLLRIVLFPSDDYESDGHSTIIADPKLSNYPNCFVRIRQPFACATVDRSIPAIFNIHSWDRVHADEDIAKFEQMEAKEWREEGTRSRQVEEQARKEEESIHAAEARIQHSNTGSTSLESNLSSDFEEEMARMEDVIRADAQAAATINDHSNTHAVATGASLSAALSRVSIDAESVVLDFDEKQWSKRYSSYHPQSIAADEFHELMQRSLQLVRLPLRQIKPHTDPSEFLISGMIQKCSWRGANLAPAVSGLTQASPLNSFGPPVNPPPPSIFIQDRSGAICEIEIPLALSSKWMDVLYAGLGGWISIMKLEMSPRVAAARSRNVMVKSMQRSFQQQTKAIAGENASSIGDSSPFMILTVTEDSLYELKHYRTPIDALRASTDTQLIPFLRNQAIVSLADIMRIRSAAQARKYGRVNLLGKIMHLNNHPVNEWQLYLTDESLRFDVIPTVSASTLPPSPTFIVQVVGDVNHRLLDSFFQLHDGIQLMDVAVEFDDDTMLPVLKADHYTDIIRPKFVEEEKKAEAHATPKFVSGARKIHPFSNELMMLPQRIHPPLQVDDQRPSLRSILRDSTVVSPLVQRHALFGINASLISADQKPSIAPCCSKCKTLLDYQRTRVEVPIVCPHCGSSQIINHSSVNFWLHYVVLTAKLEGMDLLPFKMQIEAAELQDLTAAVGEEQKVEIFRSDEAFKRFVASGHQVNTTCIVDPNTYQITPVDLASNASAHLAFQVATRVACAPGTMGGASQMTQTQTQSQWIDPTPEQVHLLRDNEANLL